MRCLVEGSAAGELLRLSAPLSFWGGVDAESGKVIDPHHPQCGTEITGFIVVMPMGRGSSSSSSVLAEMLRLGTGPAGLVLESPDGIIVTGAIVANALYDVGFPVLVGDLDPHASGRHQIEGSSIHPL